MDGARIRKLKADVNTKLIHLSKKVEGCKKTLKSLSRPIRIPDPVAREKMVEAKKKLEEAKDLIKEATKLHKKYK